MPEKEGKSMKNPMNTIMVGVLLLILTVNIVTLWVEWRRMRLVAPWKGGIMPLQLGGMGSYQPPGASFQQQLPLGYGEIIE